MSKKIISTKNAPVALGPYSQAISKGNFLFVSGQIGIDPNTGELLEGIEFQTKQTFSNIKAILKAAEYSLADVVSCDVYLNNLKDFAEMNRVYAEEFDLVCEKKDYPARATVEVARLPKDCLVEIRVTALK